MAWNCSSTSQKKKKKKKNVRHKTLNSQSLQLCKSDLMGLITVASLTETEFWKRHLCCKWGFCTITKEVSKISIWKPCYYILLKEGIPCLRFFVSGSISLLLLTNMINFILQMSCFHSYYHLNLFEFLLLSSVNDRTFAYINYFLIEL